MSAILEKRDVNSEELADLLKKREEGEVDFLLVDIREDFEYEMGHIKGVDMLKPTSTFQSWAQSLIDETKDKKVILTCRSGSRSAQVQQIFAQNGHPGAINHFGGLVTYRDEIAKPA